MKSNFKAQMQRKRDNRATELMLLRILGELHKHEGYGEKRLKRLYDYVLLESHKDYTLEMLGIKENPNDSYYSWGIRNGLTPQEFEKRQAKALMEWNLELQRRVQEHVQM